MSSLLQQLKIRQIKKNFLPDSNLSNKNYNSISTGKDPTLRLTTVFSKTFYCCAVSHLLSILFCKKVEMMWMTVLSNQ